jgi:hypothetical protein
MEHKELESIRTLAHALHQQFLDMEETAGHVLLIMISASEEWKKVSDHAEIPWAMISGNNPLSTIVAEITDWWNKGYFVLGAVRLQCFIKAGNQLMARASTIVRPEDQKLMNKIVELIKAQVTNTNIQ